MSISKWIVILLGALLVIGLVSFGGCYAGFAIGERMKVAQWNEGQILEDFRRTIFLSLLGGALGLAVGAFLAWRIVQNASRT